MMKRLLMSLFVDPVIGTYYFLKGLLVGSCWLAAWLVAVVPVMNYVDDKDREAAGVLAGPAALYFIALIVLTLIGLIGGYGFFYPDHGASWYFFSTIYILTGTNIFSGISRLGSEVRSRRAEEKERVQKIEAPKPLPEPVKPPEPQPDQKSPCDLMMDKVQAAEFPTEAQARELSNEVLNLVADGKVSKSDGQRLSKMIQNARENAIDNEPTV